MANRSPRIRRLGCSGGVVGLALALLALGCSDSSASAGLSASGASGSAAGVAASGGAMPGVAPAGSTPEGGGDSDALAGGNCGPEMSVGCDTALVPPPTETGGTENPAPEVAASSGEPAAPDDAGVSSAGGPTDAAAPGAPEEVFSPCPRDGSPCIVMPFGDSITEGFPVFNGGYRVELFRRALLGGHSITFVGVRANGPPNVGGQPFPRGHEGYSGFTIDPSSRSGISPRSEPAIAAFGPHIILLMIGTNDIDLQIDVANAPARLGALIDRITAAAPGSLLVVAPIIPTANAVTNERIRAYDAAIPPLIAARQAAGKHIVGVDMFAAFTDNENFATEYLVDSLHPNDAGYALMGQRWYQTIEPFLSVAP